MRVMVILNPKAGAGKAGAQERLVANTLRSLGVDLTCREPAVRAMRWEWLGLLLTQDTTWWRPLAATERQRGREW